MNGKMISDEDEWWFEKKNSKEEKWWMKMRKMKGGCEEMDRKKINVEWGRERMNWINRRISRDEFEEDEKCDEDERQMRRDGSEEDKWWLKMRRD